MNVKKLILTDIKSMDRSQWLEFRLPVTHALKLLELQTGLNIEKDKNNRMAYINASEFFKSNNWKDFMFPTLGASEMASILGLNEYKSSVELYYEKIGLKPIPDFDNPAMFWGRELEKEIADKWQYWDGNEETMIDNYNNKSIIRRCRNINFYVQNKSFPWIFVSIDRIINKTKEQAEGSLECKTISGWAADKWEAGIPPMYYIQNQTQLVVPDLSFGEIAILKDGRKFDVLPIERNEGICNKILEKAEDFFNRVKIGVQYYILSEFADTDELKAISLHHAHQQAPDPDGSVSYENYLKTNHKDTGGAIVGGDNQHDLALDYIKFKQQIEEVETKQRECSNILKGFLGDNSIMTFENSADTVTWKANVKGARVFKVNIKS